MKPQSCKAKGRRFQQQIVSDLYNEFELGEGDLRSTSMGAGGEDIQMSARARELIPYSFEAKNQERLNIWSAIEQSEQNCLNRKPVVVIKKNQKKPYAVIPWETFLSLISNKETKDKPEKYSTVDIEHLKNLVKEMSKSLNEVTES